MGRGGEGSGGSHGGGGGHFNYGSSRGGGHSRGGGRSSSNYNPVYRTSYYRPMTPLGGTLSIVLAIIVIVAGLIAARPNIQQSTIERSKLDSSLCTRVDTWYQDDINWIHDEKTLLKGLKTFYDKTGVQPYLWITDNINGKAKPNTSDFETALKSKYSELFKDEGHVIVCFMESSPSVYATYYWAGSAAKGVIDDEAGEILLDVIDSKYTSDLSDEEMFSKSFSDAATRMMKVGRTTKQLIIIAVIVLLCLGFVVSVYLWVKTRAKARAEEAEERERILNTDINEMSDSVLNKYNKEN